MLIVGFGYEDLIFHSRYSMFLDKDCLVVWCRPAGRESNTLYGYGGERIWSSVECAVAGKGVQDQCEPEAMSKPTQVMLAGKAHPAARGAPLRRTSAGRWGIGQGHGDDPAWDAVEAGALYDLLERKVIPEFYARDESGPLECARILWQR